MIRALTELKLSFGGREEWSDQVSFEILEALVKESQELAKTPGATHEGIVDLLRDKCLALI